MVIDITGLDIVKLLAGLAGIITGITGLVKALNSIKEAKAAKADAAAIVQARKETAEQRDAEVEKLNTQIQVLKNEISNHDRRLQEGSERFTSLETEVKETNGLLREILGALKIKFNLPVDGSGKI